MTRAPRSALAAMSPERLAAAVLRDPNALAKLIITGVITALALAFTPLLIGLLGWAVLFGTQVTTIRNLRRGVLHPLPRWEDFEGLFQQGWRPTLAALIYALPLLGLAMIQWTLGGIGGWVSGAVALMVLCATPLLAIVYLVVLLPAYTLALGQYGESGRLREFFRVGALLRLIRTHVAATLTYAAVAAGLSVTLGILWLIPCVGWAAALLLTIPLTGVWGGIYAAAVLGRPAVSGP